MRSIQFSNFENAAHTWFAIKWLWHQSIETSASHCSRNCHSCHTVDTRLVPAWWFRWQCARDQLIAAAWKQLASVVWTQSIMETCRRPPAAVRRHVSRSFRYSAISSNNNQQGTVCFLHVHVLAWPDSPPPIPWEGELVAESRFELWLTSESDVRCAILCVGRISANAAAAELVMFTTANEYKKTLRSKKIMLSYAECIK